jgi:hypothetical protein
VPKGAMSCSLFVPNAHPKCTPLTCLSSVVYVTMYYAPFSRNAETTRRKRCLVYRISSYMTYTSRSSHS